MRRLPCSVAGMRLRLSTVWIGASIVAASACSSGAPSKVVGAPQRAPDEAYETDGGHAYRVLVWSCLPSNERVVMIQSCGEGCMGCNGWQVERTPCTQGPPTSIPSAKTPFEVTLGEQSRHPIPEGSGWR